MRSKPTPRMSPLAPWWLRLAIYVLVAVTGLVLTAMGFADSAQVDSWLEQVGPIAATIGGLLAAINTGRASDQHPDYVGEHRAPDTEE